MRGYRRSIVFLMTIFILATGLLLSEDAQAVKGKIFTENGMYYKKQDYYIFTDNPRLEYKDYLIYADTIEYYDKDDKAVFIGNVIIHRGETKISGDRMNADLNSDEFIIDDNVNIYYVRKSKQSSDEAKKEAKNEIIELTAKHVVFKAGDDDHLIAEKSVVMKFDDQVIKSEYLEYTSVDEFVTARENVHVTGEDGEDLVCEVFNYNLEGEEEGFTATGGVILEFTIDDEEDTESSEKDAENVEPDEVEPVKEESVETESVKKEASEN